MRFFALILLLSGAMVPAAFAQLPDFNTSAKEMPPTAFPALPPSRGCTKDDLIGAWKQLKVFELPPGAETSAFAAQPVQYMIFLADSTFGHFSSSHAMSSEAMFGIMLHPKDGEELYTLDTNGSVPMVYMYQNGIAIDGLACFIVTNDSGTFKPGEMLLMPPENESQVRMVKSYQKMWTPPPGWVKPK